MGDTAFTGARQVERVADNLGHMNQGYERVTGMRLRRAVSANGLGYARRELPVLQQPGPYLRMVHAETLALGHLNR